MPKIRILKETGGYEVGQVVDAEPELYEGWIKSGLVELVEPDADEPEEEAFKRPAGPPGIETAEAPPARETATTTAQKPPPGKPKRS